MPKWTSLPPPPASPPLNFILQHPAHLASTANRNSRGTPLSQPAFLSLPSYLFVLLRFIHRCRLCQPLPRFPFFLNIYSLLIVSSIRYSRCRLMLYHHKCCALQWLGYITALPYHHHHHPGVSIRFIIIANIIFLSFSKNETFPVHHTSFHSSRQA